MRQAKTSKAGKASKREETSTMRQASKLKTRRLSKSKVLEYLGEAAKTEAERQRQDKRIKAVKRLSQVDKEAILKAGVKLEKQHRQRGFTKTEREILDSANALSQGNLETSLNLKGMKVTLRQIAKRFVSNPVEAIVRGEAKAKSTPLQDSPMLGNLGIDSAEAEERDIYNDTLVQDSLYSAIKPHRPKIDKLQASQFRTQVEEILAELERLPQEVKVYLASAYVMSTRAKRRLWADREDTFQSILTSLFEVRHKTGSTLAEAQAYVIAKRRLIDYWREVYKQSRESSLESSLVGEDILRLPQEVYKSLIAKRGNSYTEEKGLNQTDDWNVREESRLLLLKAKYEAVGQNNKLRTERREARQVLRDTLEYSRIAEAETDLDLTLKGIKDTRFKRIFIEVKTSESSKLSEVLGEADYTYLRRYLDKYPIVGERLYDDYICLKRAKTGEADNQEIVKPKSKLESLKTGVFETKAKRQPFQVWIDNQLISFASTLREANNRLRFILPSYRETEASIV